MMPKFILLWTDAALFALVATCLFYAWHVRRTPTSRATWSRVAKHTPAMCSAVVLSLFVVIGLLDSVHFQPQLPPALGAPNNAQVVYAPKVVSLLDVLLADTALVSTEKTYSAPLAWKQFTKESILQEGGEPIRDFPRLRFGGKHLENPEVQWLSDVTYRAMLGGISGLLLTALIGLIVSIVLNRSRRKTHLNKTSPLECDTLENHAALTPDTYDPIASPNLSHSSGSGVPWRAMLITFGIMSVLLGITIGLASGYHVLGTDRTGNDVLWQALKSIRTAWVIGTLTTVAMLPPAIIFGLTAGYFKGWVDDVIQYIYTTLTSVPGVLLIAACVLMMQVFIDTHPDLFPTSAQRADIRLFLLCLILGLTGWAGLCRLLRAEVLKLRELEYVQAARAFGLRPWAILYRHVLPNVMHLILITLVLEFSGLVLYEAVLSYLGIGVDPSMNSFGTMIDASRLDMSRDPMVWWTLLAAFIFMLALVLPANLFADGVRDAFDPRGGLMNMPKRRAAWAQRLKGGA
jgi:peptide/nickel transport system permease protein